MSMKQEIETWVSALSHYDSSNYEEAIAAFQPIADTSKILFNCGVIRASIGDHVAAVQYYQRAVSLDQYLAVAYFQQGVSNFLMGDFEEALSNFNDALLYLRGNKCIDYEQLGLKFKLYSCEALFNRGLCYIYLRQTNAGMRDLTYAAKEKAVPNHDVIDDAIKDRAEGYTVFSIPVGIVFRPSEAKVRNVQLRDYMGRARLVAAADGPDVMSQRRNFALEHWGKDERSSDSISFAATHLVRAGTSSRARQQSEPPMNRNLFPPTPPPEAEKPTFAWPPRQPSPDRVADSGRSRSLNRRPSRLQLGAASLNSPNTRKELPVLRVETAPTPAPVPEPILDRPRPHMMRSASERPADRIPERSVARFETVRRPEPGLSFSPIERLSSKWSSKNLSPDSARGFFKTHTVAKQLRLHRPASIEEVDEGNNGAYTAGTTDVSPASAHPSTDQDAALRLSWHLDRRLSMASSTREPTAAGGIRLKAHFGKDIRYLTVHPSIGFDDLSAYVAKKFGLKGTSRLQTRDEEGDMITMADQEDLDTAVAMSSDARGKEGKTAAKLEIWVQGT